MAATDYFLKLEGIDGESSDDKHKSEIDLESFSWGVNNAGGHSYGGGGGAGKASFQDFHFVMKANKASPKLMLACATGEHIRKGVLTVRKAGGKQEAYLVVTLSDLLVSSYQTGGSGHGDPIPVEQISLNFSKVEIEHKVQTEKGAMGSPVKVGYDVKANKKL